VGEATAAAVREAFPGEEPALRPASGTGGAALAEALAVQGVRGSRVLLPVSSRGRPELEQGLVAAGARVERVVAYSSQAPQGFARAWAEAMDLGAELVVFASPSAVAAVAEASGPKPRLPAVVIGPTTEAAARAAGFRIRAAANEASEEGLLGAVVRALAGLA
jgi:uroporphyrinogen-III synthase